LLLSFLNNWDSSHFGGVFISYLYTYYDSVLHCSDDPWTH